MPISRRWRILLVASAVVLAGCRPAPAPYSPPAPAQFAPPAGQAGTLSSVPDLVEALRPSVATIFTERGLGSAVVYRADGILVTNEHVIRGFTDVVVAFADGTRVPGTVLAADRRTDLAVVEVPRQGLPVPNYARELPRQGELAVVIGSPLGLESTVTAGVISGLGREISGSATRGQQPLVNLIQTDAPISPGNSGGALLDGRGTVIGISEAYLPPQSGAVAIGFAIPSITVIDVVDQLLADGTVDHPYLGVALAPLTETLRRALGMSVARGVVVLEVQPDGPAAEAGVRPGDVITGLADQPVASVGDVLGTLRTTDPGQTVPLTVQRGGQPMQLSVTIGERPA